MLLEGGGEVLVEGGEMLVEVCYLPPCTQF